MQKTIVQSLRDATMIRDPRSPQRRSVLVVLGGVMLLTSNPIFAQGQHTALPTGAHAATKQAQTTQQNTKHVTLTVQDSSVGYVVRTLGKQAGYPVVLIAADSILAKRVSVRIVNAPVMDAFTTALRGTGLVAKFGEDGRTIMVSTGSAKTQDSVAKSSGRISGVVMDSATGVGIPKVTVQVVGTKEAAVTDSRGEFRFSHVTSGEHQLSVRYFGYKSVERRVVVPEQGAASVRVALVPIATTLSGVVTTATGVQRRLEVGNDITVIDVDSVMKTAPITTVTDLLESRVPGLTVQRTSGTPGDPARIRIRGASSIERSNDPIVIVDGVRQYYSGENALNATSDATGVTTFQYARPSALDQIDPNSIETIEVFKGPSASAMYGSDAANGVIVITTKRGRVGSTRWTLAADAGTSSIPGQYPEFSYSFGHPMAGGGGRGMICNRVTKAFPCTIDTVITFQALNDARFTPLGRGQDLGVSTSVSGGTQSVLYSMTGSAKRQVGMIRLPRATEEQYRRYADKAPPSWMMNPDQYGIWSLTSQVSFILNPKMRATLNSMFSSGKQRRSSLGMSGISELIGKFVDTAQLSTLSVSPGTNALMTGFSEQATARTTTNTTAGTFNWQARNWLNVTATGGINQNSDVDKRFTPANIPFQLVAKHSDTAGGYSLGRQSVTVTTITIGAVTQSTILGGRMFRTAWGFNGQNTQSSMMAGKGAVTDGIDDPTQLFNATQSMSGGSTFGWYVEPSIQLSPRFSFSPGIRLDGSGVSGSRAGLLRLPKMSTSWIAIDNTSTDGELSQWKTLLSLVRFRGALGYAGVQPGPSDQYRLFNEDSRFLDGSTTGTKLVILNSLGNTKLRPERSTEFETGIDAELLRSRISWTATYFYKKRIDAIVSQRVAASVGGGGAGGVVGFGISSFKQNIGDILSSGLELTGSARILDNPTVNLGVNFSFSSRTDKLLTLNDDVLSPAPGDGNSRLVPGYPLDGIWVRPLRGYSDKNENGVIDIGEVSFADSTVYLGTQNPRFLSAFGTDLGLLNGRVRVNLQLSYQGDFTQKNALGLHYLTSVANQPNSTLEQQAILASALEAENQSRYLYQTVNTLRLQSAAINYRLPDAFARVFRAQMATVSVQGSNLWLHTNYSGKDPNVNGIIRGEGVADTGQLPIPRVWVLRLNLSN